MSTGSDKTLEQVTKEFRTLRDEYFEKWRKKRDKVDEIQAELEKAKQEANDAAQALMEGFGKGPFMYENEWYAAVKRSVGGRDLFMIRKASEMKKDQVDRLVAEAAESVDREESLAK